ncbi:MAG: hypothetical protein DMG83_05085, partial [Acidobacteria bacterium]
TGNNRLFPLNLAGSGRSHGNTSICRARVFHSGCLGYPIRSAATEWTISGFQPLEGSPGRQFTNFDSDRISDFY